MSSPIVLPISTPVRANGASKTDINSESPLPTPPQAMHDLFRNGRVAAAATTRSSLSGYDREEKESSVNKNNLHSSSPSTRAATSTSRGYLRATVGSNRSPSSLAVSMGAVLPSSRHGNALGSQMGILQDSAYQNSSPRTDAVVGEASYKPIRPGQLTHSSQRSASYEVSGTPRRISDEAMKMNTRPSYMSLTSSTVAALPTSALSRESNKENLMEGKGHQRRTSSARRYSSKRSPSPTRADGEKLSPLLQDGSEGNSHRRSSAESEKKLSTSNPGGSLRRSSDEAAAPSRRRPLEESQSQSPSHQNKESKNEKDEVLPIPPSMALPGMSQYTTPGLTNGARVLRSGHAPKQAPAPWSVGRSIKRMDRHYAPDKAPQRIVASQEEEEDEDEEDEQKQVTFDEEEEYKERAWVRRRDLDRARLDIHGEDEELRWIQREGGSARPSAESSRGEGKNHRGLLESGSDGSGRVASNSRTPPLQVPLGADEDEEEDDYVNDHHRLHRAEQYNHATTGKRSIAAREVEPAIRKAAMQDILAAKIPQVVNRRTVGEGVAHNLGLSSTSGRDLMSSNSSTVVAPVEVMETRVDFMAQVRLETERQQGREHLERLSNKPSKDLETKFNGYKFKKIRKAGEGGFSTVWQVRGPFAAPDPQQPGQYIDVPESEQAFFAMKQVTLKKMEKISREEVLEECNLLQSLAGKRNNEDFILRFFGWKSSTGSLKILLELGEHDFNYILREKRLSREQIMQYWHQMLEAVHFTHEEGNIVHTDLKPANFLMANGRLKLIDFGIAQKIPVGTIHIKRDAMIGTPNYMAPETVKAVKEARKEGKDPARVYKAGKASDVWALGCIFYQMVYNRPPFEAFHGDEKLKEILDPKHTIHYPPHRPCPRSNYRSNGGKEHEGEEEDDDEEEEEEEEMEQVDEEMIDVMQLTFIYNPQDRVTIPQLLHHPFIASVQDESNRSREEETVPISKATLKEILRKIYAYSRSGELHEDDLDEKGDVLFENLQEKHLLH